jgi:hypothetical protein
VIDAKTKLFFLLFFASFAMACIFAFAWSRVNDAPRGKTELGITFSWVYARDLGFNPVKMYTAILDELEVKKVRLPIYWSDVERAQSEYDWAVADSLVQASEKNGVDLTLVVGMKVPRWPECYIPDWAKGFESARLQEATLSFIKKAVDRYKNSSSVIRWQVENEPFFPYGECPTITRSQFQERVDLVRKLDTRPIQVTVSGEIGPWVESAKAADVLGLSMYRETWNDFFGYFVYPFSPEFYYLRASLVRNQVEKVIVSELQAEPWFPFAREAKAPRDWYDYFTVEMLGENLKFVREAGLPEAYLWGAEWWYALKADGEDRLWEAASGIFSN